MRLCLFVSCFLVYFATFASSGLVINEQDIVSLIKKNNDMVKAGEHEVQGLDSKTGALARSFIPKASLSAGQESFKYVSDDYETQPYYGAKLELNIYNGGRDRLKNEIAKVDLKKGKSNQKINVFKQIEMARKSFWRALFLKSLVSQYELALRFIKKSRASAVKRIKAGVATNSDKYEFEIKNIELKQDLKRTQLQLAKEKGYLKILLGLREDQNIILNQKLEHDHDWRKLTAHSEDEHSYLLEPSKLEVERSTLQSSLGSRKWLPKLDAYALWMQYNQRRDYDRPLKEDRQQTALGIRATWNFSDFVEANVQEDSAQSYAKSNQLKLAYRERELENELHMELKELELLDSMVHDAEENIKRSKKFVKLINSEYRRGVKTSGDMLFATEKLIESEIRKMTIIRDFHMAKAHIMAKLGQ